MESSKGVVGFAVFDSGSVELVCVGDLYTAKTYNKVKLLDMLCALDFVVE